MVLPCLGCIDITNRVEPNFHYAISSFGVVLSAAISPFLLSEGDNFNELVALSDSFGYLSICFGTCRL